MNVNVMIGIVVAVMLAALIGTFVIGLSKGNREENPDYMKRTGKNWTKLISIYIAVVLIVVLVFIFIWKR